MTLTQGNTTAAAGAPSSCRASSLAATLQIWTRTRHSPRASNRREFSDSTSTTGHAEVARGRVLVARNRVPRVGFSALFGTFSQPLTGAAPQIGGDEVPISRRALACSFGAGLRRLSATAQDGALPAEASPA